MAFRMPSGAYAFTASSGGIPIDIACKACIGCRLEASSHWATRCVHEAQMHEYKCAVTLTYDKDHLPPGGSLRYRDFKLFLKNIRQTYGPVRYFMCGEYGDKLARPHYHALLFGFDFPDKHFFKTSKTGAKLYNSEILKRLWPHGHALIGAVDQKSARYIAGYCMKKVGKQSDPEWIKNKYGDKIPEFGRMSTRPGIGLPWLAKYGSDVFPRDEVVIEGQKLKVPPYYFRKMKEVDSIGAALITYSRQEAMKIRIPDTLPARLKVREICTRGKLALKSRSLETS